MTSFELVTPSIRFDNCKKILRSIEPFINTYEIKWTIVFDSSEKIFFSELDKSWIRQLSYHEDNGIAGNHQRNRGLDNISGNGIYFSLDDDTILHPNFLPQLHRYSELYPEKNVFCFHDQLISDEIYYSKSGQMKECKVGNQNFAIRREFIGSRRFNIHYNSDGEFIEKLEKQFPNEFVFIPEILAYHNRLNRPDWESFLPC